MTSEKKGRRRFRSLTVGMLFLGSLLGMLGIPYSPIENVAAQDFIAYSDASLDGQIEYEMGAGYVVDTADGGFYVGGRTFLITGDRYWYHSYCAWDTSSIPDDAVIQRVTLKFRLSIDQSTSADFNVEVYKCDYVTLDTSDYSTYGEYQGILMNTAGAIVDNWYSIDVKVSSLNDSGNSGYMLKSSRDTGGVPLTNEYIQFYSADYLFDPVIEVWYSTLGTDVFIELSGSWTTWLNSTVFASIEQWNLTYDIWTFNIETVPLALNVTVGIQNISWEYLGHSPYCNYSITTTELVLQDVYDSICYSVYFAVPKINPYTTVHLALYHAFTGEGFYWEMFRVQICEGSSWDNTTSTTVAKPDFFVEPEANYTIRVLDFFGNALVDYPFSANAQDIFISLPVPAYSWQIFNMNDAPVLMRIYWNNSGSPWEFFVGPHWIIERFLKGGDYTFMTTFYNTDGTAGDTVYFNRTVPMTGLNASFVYVNGTTLYEIVSSIEGVMAVQLIITSLVSPSIVLIYEDLPLAPVKLKALTLSTPLAIDPYVILETTTYQNRTTLGGVNATLWTPYPSVVGATYYVLSDVLSFSGTFASIIYINQTDGTNLYYNTILPATVNLQGQNLTVWSNNPFAVSRATVWREITEYTVNYYATEKRYEATLALNNSCSFTFYAPYWFIGFPNYTVIDLESVRVYDLDNGLLLSEHTNFEVSSGGVHLTLNQLNASAQRNIRLTYWDENSTSGLGAPNLVAEAYTQETLNGASMKYTAVQWTNPYSVEYRGEVYITLNFTYGDQLIP